MPDTEDVSFPIAGGHAMRAALARPAGKGPHPGVIVIHEVFGLNDDIRTHAARMAQMGYVALAPDLYDRPGMRALCVARTFAALRRGSGDAFDDLDAARQWLAARPDVDGSRIGVVGFCLGGGFALLYAVRAPVKVSAPFYGDVPRTRHELEGVCPVVASFGGRDRLFARHAERLHRMLTELGVDHDVKIYPDAGHSFVSQHSGVMATLGAWGPLKVGYNPAAAADAWQRVESFFKKHLG